MDSRIETYEHIRLVQNLLGKAIRDLLCRQEEHDRSKLESPEVEILNMYAGRLAAVTYGSPEYQRFLAELQPALQHHYACPANGHHPENHADGIRGMCLLDLVEMICDWKAASLRHNDGNIRRSIEINQGRFGYSDELKRIFLNTLVVLEGPSPERNGHLLGSSPARL